MYEHTITVVCNTTWFRSVMIQRTVLQYSDLIATWDYVSTGTKYLNFSITMLPQSVINLNTCRNPHEHRLVDTMQENAGTCCCIIDQCQVGNISAVLKNLVIGELMSNTLKQILTSWVQSGNPARSRFWQLVYTKVVLMIEIVSFI